MDVMGVETMIQKTAYWLCPPYSYTLLYAWDRFKNNEFTL